MKATLNELRSTQKKEDPSLLVIGWDAATWDLLSPWIEAGKLPHLAALMRDGVSGTITSTPLPVSPAAWSSILTGQNPGRHGVFDWYERKADSYDFEYVNTGRIRATALWDYFNMNGKRVGVFNPPMLYPAVPMDGFMLSGMAAPSASAEQFSFPPSLIAEIEERFGHYMLDEGTVFSPGQEKEYLESVLKWLEYQKRIIKYLLQNHPCDAYLLVLMQSDHIQHKFWRYADPTFPGYEENLHGQYRDAILLVYQALDAFLGELRQMVGEQTNIVLLSDHGAGPTRGVVYINRWLQDMGLLHIKRDFSTRMKFWLAKTNLISRIYKLIARMGFAKLALFFSKPARDKVINSFLSFSDIDWAMTKAYSHGSFGQIFLNLKGREPEGIVNPGFEYEQLLAEIIHRLKELKHPQNGNPLITHIRRREEVFEGPYVGQTADLLFSIQDYHYLPSKKLGLDQKEIFGPSEYADTGTHRPEGILVMAGPSVKQSDQRVHTSVMDMTPTFLALAGLSVPRDLDGKPMLGLLTQEANAQFQWAVHKGSPQGDSIHVELDPQEINLLEDRLRNLGYLE